MSTSVHPLMAKKYKFIQSWEEWKKLWEAATHLETLHSLLHFGFRVRVRSNEAAERLMFYLQIADGHTSTDSFRSRESGLYPIYDDSRYYETTLGKGWPDEAIRSVSQKAFVTLCQSFFKGSDKEQEKGEDDLPGLEYEPAWACCVDEKQVMDQVIRFLRIESRGSSSFSFTNLDVYYSNPVSKNNFEIAKRFAFNLARYILCYKDNGGNQARREFLEGYRGQAIDLLAGFGKLDLLLHGPYRSQVDQVCVERLRVLAMESRLYMASADVDSRLVKSIEEAVFAGSQAAKVLHLFLTMNNQEKRLKHIAKLERQRKDAEQRLKELNT